MTRVLRAALSALLLLLPVAAVAQPMLRDEASGLEYLEVMTGGAAASERVPVVLAIHGLGDRPSSFRLFVDDLPAKARLVVPKGPIPHGEDGASWFDFHAEDPNDAALAAGVRAAADRLAILARSVATRGGAPARVVVCGFSQGGMLSFALASSFPDLVAAAVPVAAWLPSPLWPTERPKTRPLPKVRALHGDADRLVPLEGASWTVEALRSNGFEVSLQSYPGVGHAISTAMRADLVTSVSAAVEELSAGHTASAAVDVQGPPAPPAAGPAPATSR